MTTQTLSYETGPQAVGGLTLAASDIACLRVAIVNVVFVGQPGNPNDWVLVDAGLTGTAGRIRAAAEYLFGAGARPRAIVMTHGHFDHVGALRTLADHWDVPIYAHEQEFPYLTGRVDYPPPDPTVGGGLMARSSFLFPRHGVDVRDRLVVLPADGSVPPMPGWRWVHTPGHTPGHVSFFRDSDRALIAGDAFITTKQESLFAVAAQKSEIHGPPWYYTIDWTAARGSVDRLAALLPRVAVTGHGPPMHGTVLAHELNRLARDFARIGMPADGRYVRRPAIADATGAVVEVPPPVSDPLPKVLLIGAVLGGVAYAVSRAVRKEEERHWWQRR